MTNQRPTLNGIDAATLCQVAGGNWTQTVDKGVSTVLNGKTYGPVTMPNWNGMSCTSKGMWMGTAAGSATVGAGILTGQVGAAAAIAPWTGTAASTAYIEACQAAGGK